MSLPGSSFARGPQACAAGSWRERPAEAGLLQLFQPLFGERRELGTEIVGGTCAAEGVLRVGRAIDGLQRNAETEPPDSGARPRAQRGLELLDRLVVPSQSLQ